MVLLVRPVLLLMVVKNISQLVDGERENSLLGDSILEEFVNSSHCIVVLFW